jgi:hypothetical protein
MLPKNPDDKNTLMRPGKSGGDNSLNGKTVCVFQGEAEGAL